VSRIFRTYARLYWFSATVWRKLGGPIPTEQLEPHHAYAGGSAVLNFASCLTVPSRFAWTVTNLQQNIGRFDRTDTAPSDPNATDTTEHVGNHVSPSPAKELSKGWRFFPTYAGG
jgi:hypothetical protein